MRFGLIVKKSAQIFIGFLLSLIFGLFCVFVFYESYPYIYVYFEGKTRSELSDDYFSAFEFLALALILLIVCVASSVRFFTRFISKRF